MDQIESQTGLSDVLGLCLIASPLTTQLVSKRLFEGYCFYAEIFRGMPKESLKSIQTVNKWLEEQGYDNLCEEKVKSVVEKAKRWEIHFYNDLQKNTTTLEEHIENVRKNVSNPESIPYLSDQLMMALFYDMVPYEEECIQRWILRTFP